MALCHIYPLNMPPVKQDAVAWFQNPIQLHHAGPVAYSHSIKFLAKSGWITPPNATFIFILKKTKTTFCHLQETKLATAYCRQYCLVVIAAFGICLSLEWWNMTWWIDRSILRSNEFMILTLFFFHLASKCCHEIVIPTPNWKVIIEHCRGVPMTQCYHIMAYRLNMPLFPNILTALPKHYTTWTANCQEQYLLQFYSHNLKIMLKAFTSHCEWIDGDLEALSAELKWILHLKVGCSNFGPVQE